MCGAFFLRCSDPRTLCQIDCEAFKVGERAVRQRTLMSSTQNHAGCLVRLECLLPARSTQAPAVTGLQTWKAEFWHRRRKIIATRFRKIEKGGSHNNAHCVTSSVLSPGIATAIPIEPCHGFERADFQRLPKHVTT